VGVAERDETLVLAEGGIGGDEGVGEGAGVERRVGVEVEVVAEGGGLWGEELAAD